MKEYLVKVGGKDFKVLADFDNILKDAKEYLNQPDEDVDHYYDHSSLHGSVSDNQVSPEEFKANVAKLIADINAIIENPQLLGKAVNRMSKKNNGWFKKGAVGIQEWYEKTCRIWEDSYCYVMWAIRLKAIDENTAELYLNEDEKDSW